MKVKEALQIFQKLEMEIREGRDTLAFFKWEGKIILWSKVPHKRGELKGKLSYFIRQQLKLNESQFEDLQECKIWREEYSYIRQTLSSHNTPQKPVHIFFAIVDHFEPYWNRATNDIALKRVKVWVEKLPEILSKFKDADGCPPKHIFFYPQEEYNPEYLDMLADICRYGLGDVEIHIHHDNV